MRGGGGIRTKDSINFPCWLEWSRVPILAKLKGPWYKECKDMISLEMCSLFRHVSKTASVELPDFGQQSCFVQRHLCQLIQSQLHLELEPFLPHHESHGGGLATFRRTQRTASTAWTMAPLSYRTTTDSVGAMVS